jgi:hypothetical protein
MNYLTATILIALFNVTASALEVKTEIVINASPEKVWAIFADFESYPKWNPFIKSLSGDVKVGNKIKVTVEPYNSKPMTFTPTVLVFETNRELRWLGHLLFGGLADGTHEFELVDNGNGTTTFRQSEAFHGILTPFFSKRRIENITKGYEAMNRRLKELAEQQ